MAEDEQRYHYDHGLLHYGVIFAAGLMLSWIIQTTYGPVTDGQAALISQNMVVIFLVASGIGIWTKSWFE